MKKAKIMLTVLTVFAVVGGALAFKSTKENYIFFKKNLADTSCNVPILLRSTTHPEGIEFPYSTQATSTGANCTILLTPAF